MGYRIGSFNLRNIGSLALKEYSRRDLSLIAKIIKKEGFDVVAIQEIRSGAEAFEGSGYFKKSILAELGPDWSFRWADTESLDSRHESYGFLWNNRRLMISKKNEDGTGGDSYVDLCRIRKDKLRRHPYYIRLSPVNGPFIEIRLICIHTPDNNDEIKKELDILLREIYPSIEDRRYGNNRPAYTILLGDYNACLWRPWKDGLLDKQTLYLNSIYRSSDDKDNDEVIVDGKRIKTDQDQLTTLKKTFDLDKRGYKNDYDHFSYDVERFGDVDIRIRRIDAVRRYCNDDFEKYFYAVSDHIPIIMEIELR